MTEAQAATGDTAAESERATVRTDVPALLREVVGIANEAHRIATKTNAKELVELLGAQAQRWQATTATIVVAGAQKRGKSRLLNALVEQPDLLPVDADIATQTHVVLQHGPQLTVRVLRQRDDALETIEIAPTELVDYASVKGDPQKRLGVQQVDVTVDSPVLGNVQLVDTPGVDSLTIGHRNVTVAALGTADALLFTVSAQDQPLLRHELEFLAEAAQRVEAIAFVLTKIDDSDHWQDLLEENRSRLADFLAETQPKSSPSGETARLDRLTRAPWIPVSAKTAERAAARAASATPERAAALLERSGLPQLRAHLDGYGRARQLVRSSQLLAIVDRVLAACADLQSERVAGAAQDPGLAAKLAAEEEQLEHLRTQARFRRRAMAGVSRVNSEIGPTVRARIDAVRQQYQQEVQNQKLQTPSQLESYLAALPDSMDKSLSAAWTDVVNQVLPAFRAELLDLMSGAGLPAEELAAETLDIPGRLADIVRRERQAGPAETPDRLVEGIPLVMGSASLAGLLSQLAVIGPFGWIAAPVAFLELARRRRRATHHLRARGEALRHINDVLSLATGEMTVALQGVLAERRVAVEESIDGALGTQRREIEQRRQELARLARRDEAERQKAATEAQAALSAITQLRSKVVAGRRRVAQALEEALTPDQRAPVR